MKNNTIQGQPLRIKQKLIQSAGSILMLFALSGCAGYSLGTTLPHDIQTLHVPTFKNQTTEPLLEVSTTDATVAQFQFDGSLRIAEADLADAVLTVTLKNYTLESLSYDRDKTTQTQEYRARVYASVVLVRLSNDEVIMDDPSVEGETTFFVTGDMTSSKKRAQPKLSEDLAKNIVDAITQTWR